MLEFGCGAAQWSIFLQRAGADCIAFDLSERQLHHARRLRAAYAVDLPLVHANAEAVPFADSSFDLVFCDHGHGPQLEAKQNELAWTRLRGYRAEHRVP